MKSTYTKVLEISEPFESDKGGIVGTVRKIKYECGHASHVQPCSLYVIGETRWCWQCEKENKQGSQNPLG